MFYHFCFVLLLIGASNGQRKYNDYPPTDIASNIPWSSTDESKNDNIVSPNDNPLISINLPNINLPSNDKPLSNGNLLPNDNLKPTDDLPPYNNLPNDNLPLYDDLPPTDNLPPYNDLPPTDNLPPYNDLPPTNNLPPYNDLPPTDNLPPYNDLPPTDNLPPTNNDVSNDDQGTSTLSPVDNKPPERVPLVPNDDVPVINKDPVCRSQFGYYRIDSKCDSFIECRNYRAAVRLCPDGMNFNGNARWPEYPCGYPMDAPCIGRGTVQPPKPTAECPRQYGFYPVNDRSRSPIERCSRYVRCAEGKAFIMNCPFGLAFNAAAGRCDWPEQVPSCRDFLGFTCPAQNFKDNEYPEDIVQNYKYSPNECSFFWSCQFGRARLLSCDYGLAFDAISGRCLDKDHVRCNPQVHRPIEPEHGEPEQNARGINLLRTKNL